MKKRNAFVLLELLLALTISAIAMTLFWKASDNRIVMLKKVEENYSYSRLISDFKILKKLNRPIVINTSHYSPLNLKVISNKIHILSQDSVIKEILE
jgi:prepilin-type N-terminal cleavage/methylation domain-containing protein